MSKFYHFNQNNSGGSFDFDLERGITHHVIIEANTKDQASALAQDIGIYFDGVSTGQDCDCCGNRWHEPYDDGDKKPIVYGKPFKTAFKKKEFGKWMDDGRECCVHYLDGRKEWA